MVEGEGEDEPDGDSGDDAGPDRQARVSAAAWLSALWPGLGHLRTARRLGTLIAIGCALIVIAAVSFTATNRGDLISWSVNRRILITIIVVAIGSLVLRLVVLADAIRRARQHPTSTAPTNAAARAGGLVALAVAVVFVTAPHVVAVVYARAQLDLLTTVFSAEETVTARPTPLPAATSAPIAPTTSLAERDATTPTPTTPTTTSPETSPPTTASTSTTVETPTTEWQPTSPEAGAATWDGEPRLTIALLGGDGGFDRRGVRTDTIIVLSIDVATGEAAAFNVPRNWQRMPFPEGSPGAELYPRGYPGIANEVYNVGVRNPEVFDGIEDPPGYSIKSSLAQLTGLPIQYYVLIDMVGVVEAIDALGGIDVEVTEWINDRIKPIEPGGPHIDIVVRPGPTHLDGLTALGYVRARTTSSDYHRMTRQRCVIEALIDQTSPGELLATYLTLTDIIEDHVTTDIPLDRLDELLVLSRSLDTDRITTVNFIPPEFKTGGAPVEQVRAAVAAALEGTEAEGNASLAAACAAQG